MKFEINNETLTDLIMAVLLITLLLC